MGFQTICVSGEDGTGALGVAMLAARELGLRMIDEDIVTKAALEAGVDRDTVASVEQRRSTVARLLESLGTAGMVSGYAIPEAISEGQPASDELRGLITSVIEEVAAGGGVMIVSHAASMALAHREDVLRVLLTASPAVRISRIATSLGLDEYEATRTLKRSDTNRADYIKRFYGISTELPIHYDLVVNTDRLPPAAAAQLIVAAANGPDAEA